MRHCRPAVLSALVLLISCSLLVAADPPASAPAPSEKPAEKPADKAGEKAGEKKDDKKDDKKEKEPGGDKLSVTEHELTVGGAPLKYRATAGTLQMKDEAGKAK